MRKSRFSVEQIVAILKQAELGMPVADITRQVGISEQTFYRWKKDYAVPGRLRRLRFSIRNRKPEGLALPGRPA